MTDRIFRGVFSTGIVWADRTREKHGDYARLCFLPFGTLEPQFENDCPGNLRVRILEEVEGYQARRGESIAIDSCGNTRILGGRR